MDIISHENFGFIATKEKIVVVIKEKMFGPYKIDQIPKLVKILREVK